MSGKIIITDHAYKRAKERLSLKKGSFDRIAELAFCSGISHNETAGFLNKYISKLYLQYKSANNIKIYGENVFLFSGNILITVYQLPNEFKKYTKKIKSK